MKYDAAEEARKQKLLKEKEEGKKVDDDELDEEVDVEQFANGPWTLVETPSFNIAASPESSDLY